MSRIQCGLVVGSNGKPSDSSKAWLSMAGLIFSILD